MNVKEDFNVKHLNTKYFTSSAKLDECIFFSFHRNFPASLLHY